MPSKAIQACHIGEVKHRVAFSRAAACIATLALAACASFSQAQEVIPDFYKDPGLNPNRNYVNQNFNEHIDPFTGALQLHYVDIHVPGDGGFDISVVRSYNSASIDENNPAAFNGQAGLGWTLHFGRVLHKSSILPCSQSTFGSDVLNNPVMELPDGTTQLLVYSGSTSPMMVTTQRWKADCVPGGGGLVVYSPNGMRYDMTQAFAVAGGTGARYAWYTTKITDRNGNSASIGYASGASPRISSFTATDGRSLDFAYNTAGMITRITANGSTYSYNYQAISGVTGAYFLASVDRPDGTSWQYQYHGVRNNVPGSYVLRQVTYPQGGSIT